jgi:hypothetical protein
MKCRSAKSEDQDNKGKVHNNKKGKEKKSRSERRIDQSFSGSGHTCGSALRWSQRSTGPCQWLGKSAREDESDSESLAEANSEAIGENNKKSITNTKDILKKTMKNEDIKKS